MGLILITIFWAIVLGVVLLFIPLEAIAKLQNAIRGTAKKVTDKYDQQNKPPSSGAV